jgi:hypothetical protein
MAGLPQGRTGIGSCRRALDQARLRRWARDREAWDTAPSKMGQENFGENSVAITRIPHAAEGNLPVVPLDFLQVYNLIFA